MSTSWRLSAWSTRHSCVIMLKLSAWPAHAETNCACSAPSGEICCSCELAVQCTAACAPRRRPRRTRRARRRAQPRSRAACAASRRRPGARGRPSAGSPTPRASTGGRARRRSPRRRPRRAPRTPRRRRPRRRRARARRRAGASAVANAAISKLGVESPSTCTNGVSSRRGNPEEHAASAPVQCSRGAEPGACAHSLTTYTPPLPGRRARSHKSEIAPAHAPLPSHTPAGALAQSAGRPVVTFGKYSAAIATPASCASPEIAVRFAASGMTAAQSVASDARTATRLDLDDAPPADEPQPRRVDEFPSSSTRRPRRGRPPPPRAASPRAARETNASATVATANAAPSARRRRARRVRAPRGSRSGAAARPSRWVCRGLHPAL